MKTFGHGFCSRWLCESCAEAEPLISDAFVRPCSDCRRGRAIERVLPLPGRCWPVQPQPPGVVNSEWRGPRPPNLLPGLEWPPPSGLVYHFDAPTACGKYAMSVKAVHAPATPQWNDDCDEDYAAVLSGLVWSTFGVSRGEHRLSERVLKRAFRKV